MKIDRLLAIVLLLLNRRKITAQELSERFEVSVRTIYRDIDSIDAAGIPIVSHQGTGGGFSILDSYRLEKQLLTPDEIMTMVSVLKGVGDALGDRQVRRSQEKMAGLVPAERSTTLSDEVRIELSPWGYRGTEDALLEGVRKATVQQKVVSFMYRNSQGESIERLVEPMTLVFKGSAWYLFGYCQYREDYRLFRLSRIRHFRVTSTAFQRKEMRYDTYMKTSGAGTETQTTICELCIAPKMRFMAEDWFSPEQLTPREDGSVTVAAPLPIGEWMVSWILSFGEYIEVVRPLTLRNDIRERAMRIARLYEGITPTAPLPDSDEGTGI